MSQTVVGIFDSTNQAQDAIEKLVARGFSREKIDLNQRSDMNERYDEDADRDEGGIGDSISNFFSNLFGSDDDEDTRKYSEVARHGSTITVHTENRAEAERAAEIMDDSGAVDVDEKAAGYFAGRGSMDRDTNYIDTDRNREDMTNRSMPVIEENLNVGKREVQSGGARLRSRIVEKPVEEHIRLRSERVNVERNPVDRPASEADFNTFKEGTMEVTEHKEVPVVNKEARVVEEVSLNKEVEENDETIHCAEN